ncbi:MAG: hypothetical protein ACE5G2_07885 [Candidatus Krumholzibacteriia bacterium]
MCVRAPTLVAALVGSSVVRAAAQEPNCLHSDITSIDASAVGHVTFDRVYTGNYRPGEPYDYVTVDPAGTGEGFAEVGITIRLRVICQPHGWRIQGIPAEDPVLFSNSLCMCAPIKTADRPTDEDGWTSFGGTIQAGGCARGLEVYADDLYLTTLPVNIISTDTGLASPYFTDEADLAALA